ncbi:hypothetical protein GLYMA_19G066650v4 [Glycine max]|nr:hypothetical protein GLYMA_19G066650v4 [Glycine max]KAH1076697.1 hypothetical protein GYH30_052279 [Glycine max]
MNSGLNILNSGLNMLLLLLQQSLTLPIHLLPIDLNTLRFCNVRMK